MATHRSAFLTLLAAYLGLFVGLIDSNAVNLALPAIRTELGAGISGAQWTVDAYSVTFAALLLTAGSLGDRFGRRRLLRIGLLLFIAASVGCALAPGLAALLAARALQGVGAALMLPQGLAIATATFPDAAGRARATAAWAIAAASSAALGPVLGGVLTDAVGWRFIFWVNIPVCVAALSMSWRYLPESSNGDAVRPDLAGQALAILTLSCLTVVLVETSALGAGWVTALGVAGLAAAAGFVTAQRRVRHPMIPPQFFTDRALVVALTATFTMTFGVYGLLLVNSLVFQEVRGAGALTTALQFLPLPLVYLLLIPMVSVLARRTGTRRPMAAGLALIAAGSAVYAAVGPTADIWFIEAAFVLAGAGLALNTGPAVQQAMAAAPVARAGLASGVVNLARLVGITVGVAVLGSAMAAVDGAGGVRAALGIGALVPLAGAAIVLRCGGVRGQRATRRQEVCHA